MNTITQVKSKEPRSEKTTKKSLDDDEDTTYYVSHADELELVQQVTQYSNDSIYNPFDY